MLLWILCLFTLSAQTLVAQSPVSAFNFSTDPTVNQLKSSSIVDKPVAESWTINLNNEFRQLSKGNRFLVPLPNGDAMSATVKSKQNYDNGDVQIIANIDNGGSIVITMGDDVTFGSINNGEISYSIGLNNDQQLALVDNQSLQNEVDLSNDIRIPPTNTVQRRSAKSARSLEQLEILSAQNTGESTIDLLVVYSNEFADLFTSPQTRINQLVSFTNTSFADSGILINLRLVAAVEIGFNNTNFETSIDQVFDDLDIILGDSTNSVGDFSNLLSLRNQHGADLVTVLSANTNTGTSAGLAWILNGSENPVFGVSTTMLSLNCCDSVFAHEIGHNLGSVHQIGDCNGGYTGFSCGFRDNTNGWATIMSSGGNKSVIGYLFSNTNNDCLGLTCGLAGSADNRTSFNMSRLIVANFRDEVNPSPTNPSPPINTDLGWLPGVLFNLIEDVTD